MKAVMVMFDSLNRRMLSPYGCDWVHTPNFDRLAARSVAFDRCYVGSMPCMPARRELHTGRYNFLHRSWGPLEPFDDSMPRLLKEGGVYTHLVSDHYHYWETGGATYHPSYSSWEINRGHEGDPWKGVVAPQEPPAHLGQLSGQDWVNRSYLKSVESQPQSRTFSDGVEFIETNHDSESWFLQIETFDPHEPFFTQEAFKRLYPHDYDGPQFDWPGYEKVTESREQVRHLRYEYAALVSMCDASLGRILDLFDRHDMWDDTLLIVNTDHGFLLGEHDWWAKCVQPFYNEVAHIPLFIWDPRSRRSGVRSEALVQTIDLPPTLLEFFGLPSASGMQGKPLAAALAGESHDREYALFGVHGGHVNCTDGRYVYMRAPANAENGPLYNYTVMPSHMRSMFSLEELSTAEMRPAFPFTKGVPLMRISAETSHWKRVSELRTKLFDLASDPEQLKPIHDEVVERRMIEAMRELMVANDAPQEQFIRLGL